MANKRLCDVEGCDNKHKGHGLCSKHLSRLKRNGHLKVSYQYGCKVEGCDKKHKGEGFCAKHHWRWKNNGDPLKTKKTPTGDPLKFLQNAVANAIEEECIIWPYDQRKGYGCLRYKGTNKPASRVALTLHTGEDPDGMEAAHGPCHNTFCVNPLHLSWKTRKENNDDRKRDGTQHKVLQGESHPCAKLTEDQVREIYDAVGTCKVIGDQFGVGPNVVSRIKRKKTWKHLWKNTKRSESETPKPVRSTTQAVG